MASLFKMQERVLSPTGCMRSFSTPGSVANKGPLLLSALKSLALSFPDPEFPFPTGLTALRSAIRVQCPGDLGTRSFAGLRVATMIPLRSVARSCLSVLVCVMMK